MTTPEHLAWRADAARESEPAQADRTGGPAFSWTSALTWLLGFVAIAYLGMKGGGYDPLVHDQIGIVAWWVLLGTVAVGALPRRRPGRLALLALVLLAAFLAWTAANLIWTESSERTFADLARISGYVGFFLLAVANRERGGARTMVAAIATGITVVALVGLLSRLHPSWFPASSHQTATFLPGSEERLSYPIDYWNGLAGLIAIGLPLLLQVATDARLLVVRALAAAALPAVILTIYFTLSRGGIAAAAIALAVFLALAPDRLPKLAAAAIGGGGGAVLIAVASSRESLTNGFLDATARHQGNEVLVIALVVCAVAALLHAGLTLALERHERPAWTVVSKPASLRALAVVVAVAFVAALAFGAPSRAADAWSEFRHSTTPVGGTERLGSVAGESRYAIWSSAVRETQSAPLTGTGSGTFEYWWNRDGTVREPVIDTHSLYLQTLGELGVVGLVVLAAFILTVLVGGGLAAFRAPPERRTALAAALAGFAAFCVSAAFDWVWQIPVLAVATLLLGAVLVTAPDGGHEDRRPLALLPRTAIALTALAVIAVIAVPLAATSLIRQSQDEAARGDVSGALSDAESAENVEPFAATPRLQRALVLEGSGALAAAAEAARRATRAEATNWRTWLVLSRIEAKRGHAAAAVDAYRRARSLNPRSPLFSP